MLSTLTLASGEGVGRVFDVVVERWPLALFLIALIALLGWWLYNRGHTSNIDGRDELPADLDWDGNPNEALQEIYKYVLGFSNKSIEWYRERRVPARRWGQFLRIGSFVVAGVAGFIPLSSDLGFPYIPPAWATVAIAVGGLLVTIDHFGGYTSGWIRFMLAEQDVAQIQETFLLEWNALKLEKATPEAKLERAKTFLLNVVEVINTETQEWATEFRKAIQEVDKARKEAAEAKRSGALEVSVTNPGAVTEWILEIDGSERGRTSGANLAVTDVFVGIRKLKAYGEDKQGKRFSDEKTVTIEGGKTVTKQLELT